jgi:hypothetical protein
VPCRMRHCQPCRRRGVVERRGDSQSRPGRGVQDLIGLCHRSRLRPLLFPLSSHEHVGAAQWWGTNDARVKTPTCVYREVPKGVAVVTLMSCCTRSGRPLLSLSHNPVRSGAPAGRPSRSAAPENARLGLMIDRPTSSRCRRIGRDRH